MQEIVNIKIEELGDFPKQEEIYGEAVVEAEFVASVKECGIITPLIVCQASEIDNSSNTPYIIISGHRRRTAAISAELEEVPCLIKYYETYEEAELEFLTCNFQREKSDRVRLKEFLHYKQTLCQIGKVRKKSRSYENTAYLNKHLSEILANKLQIEDYSNVALDSYEILKKITGFTEYEQTYLTVLYDGDWLQKRLDKLRILKCPLALEEELIRLREQAVKVYEDGDCTLNNAVSEIKRIFAQAEDKLKPKEKPQPREKLPKVEKKQLQLFVAMEESEIDEENSSITYLGKYGNCELGIVVNSGLVSAHCIKTAKGVYLINPERLVELAAKEIGI